MIARRRYERSVRLSQESSIIYESYDSSQIKLRCYCNFFLLRTHVDSSLCSILGDKEEEQENKKKISLSVISFPQK